MSGIGGVVEHARRRDDEVGRVARCRRRVSICQRPSSNAQRVTSLPKRIRGVDAVAARDVLEVGLDLGARREAMAPLRVRREGVAVEVRGHVAGDARVGVLAPGPAEAIGLLVDREVVEAGLLQLDRAEDARHAGADDDDARLGARRIRGVGNGLRGHATLQLRRLSNGGASRCACRGPSQYGARRSRFSTFIAPESGSGSVRNSTDFGTL